MSEITKLYKNANITPERCSECNNNMDCGFNKDCYPPFTAEKQIELIKNVCPSYPLNYHIKCFQDYSFEEGLAKCINNLWQDLTEQEKQQVKGILK